MHKAGMVALIGRPNTGKSTLLNNLLGHKVAITSPKPQTTRFPIEAVYEDERGQIIFVDTPGIFGETPDTLSRSINAKTQDVLIKHIDVLIYLIDPSRPRDSEENKTLGLVRKSTAPKILVVNKSDIKKPNFWSEYAFYTDEFPQIIHISALKNTNFDELLEAIFEKLPEHEKLITERLNQPVLNMDSKQFVAEIIREKVFLQTNEEIPYTVDTRVDTIEERANGMLYIHGIIITTDDRYKKMIIGAGGRKIRDIGMAVRKELETATGKRVYVDLIVTVNPHWQDAV